MAAFFEVAVEAVFGDIEFAVFEPFDVGLVEVTACDGGPLFFPLVGVGDICPVGLEGGGEVGVHRLYPGSVWLVLIMVDHEESDC